MRFVLGVVLLYLAASLHAQSPQAIDHLNQTIAEFNEANATVASKLLQAFDQAEQLLLKYDDSDAASARRNATLQSIRNDRKKFIETYRLPEVGSMILARSQYHQTLYPVQKKLLAAFDAAIAESKQSQQAFLKEQRGELLKQMPASDQFVTDSTWKGFRYNALLARKLYEFTPLSISRNQVKGTLKFDKNEIEVEGTINGPILELRLTNVVSGKKGSEDRLQGIILGNRMLLNMQAGGDYPTILYKQ